MTTENRSIQVVASVDPKITTGVGTAIWNNAEVTEYLERKLEKYKDLVVTADNLKEMKGVLREIVSIRTKLQSFGTEQKRVLKIPYNTFVGELEQVLAVVGRVESPISNQIQVFENEEKERRKEAVMKLIEDKFNSLDIREEYRSRFVPNVKWWENKTAKIDSVASAIDDAIHELREQQMHDDEIVRLRAEKVEMIKLKVELFNSQYELNTPITFDDVAYKVVDASLVEIDNLLRNEFDKQLEREQVAAAVATATVTKEVVQDVKANDEPANWTTNKDYHEVERPLSKKVTYVLTVTDEQAAHLEDQFNKLCIEWSRI